MAEGKYDSPYLYLSARGIITCSQDVFMTGVKFMIGQVGTADAATRFLDTLRSNDAIRPVTFVTSGTFAYY